MNERRNKGNDKKKKYATIRSIAISALILMSTAAIVSDNNNNNNNTQIPITGNDKQQERSAFATFPGTNGKIAFTSNRDGNFEIYVMNADGSNQQRITFDSSRESDPSWSPDGTKIAFVSDRYGSNQWDILVMNADGSNQQRLTNINSDDISPSWLPDGRRIVFVSNREDSNRNRDYDIFVMNADGSNQQRLTNNNEHEYDPSWSPNGREIAFHSWIIDSGRTDIFKINADGSSNPIRLTSTAVYEYDPSWSPNGREIAYRVDYPIDRNYELQIGADIFVMNADGSNQHDVSRSYAPIGRASDDSQPSWSPDGTKIAFTSNRDGNFEIYVMNADGSNQQRLTNNNRLDSYPDWGPRERDQDGICDDIDTQPTMFSNEFSDRNLSPAGRAFGRITERGNGFTTICELGPNPDRGVHVTDHGGSRLATIRACDDVGYILMQGRPLQFPSRWEILCHSGQASVWAEQGTVRVTLVANDGRTAIVDLPAPDRIEFRFSSGTLMSGSWRTILTVTPVADGVAGRPISLAPGGLLVIPEIIPPETRIDSATDSRGNPIESGTKTPSIDITFEFSSPDTDVSYFNCNLAVRQWLGQSWYWDWDWARSGIACTSPQSYSGLREDLYRFEVLAFDSAGNRDPTPAVFIWEVDFTAPETTIDSATDSRGNPIESGTKTPSTSILFRFSSPDTDVTGFECKLDKSDWELCSSTEGGGVTVGAHTFSVRAFDSAGNVDTTPAVFRWIVT
jgi:Tol biopolymer transport system component